MGLDTRTEYTQAGIPIVHLHGDIELDTCPKLRDLLNQLLSDGRSERATIVLNLSDVPFVDSAGLGVLVDVARRAREQGGAVHLVQVLPFVLRTFEMTRLTRLFGVHDSLPAALEAIERPEKVLEAERP